MDDQRKEYLLELAMTLEEASQFTEAAKGFGKLISEFTDEEIRFPLMKRYANCLRLAAQVHEALEVDQELYRLTREQPRYYGLAYAALNDQLDCLRVLGQAELDRQVERVQRIIALVDEGLQWLEAKDLSRWRHMLLLSRSQAYWISGDSARALEDAEEAFRLRKANDSGPGYNLGNYAWWIARYAGELGCFDRGLQVLDEVEGKESCYLTRVQSLTERVRLLRLKPAPDLAAAKEYASRLKLLAQFVGHPRAKLYAYREFGLTALARQEIAEAEEALRVMCEIALEHHTIDHQFLLREARKALCEAREIIAKTSAAQGDHPSEWLRDFEARLSAA